MAHRTPTTTTTHSSKLRKYPSRRSPPARRIATPRSSSNSSAESSSRPVLVALHPNLRRLPSRLLLAQKYSMQPESVVQVGAKRKRTVSRNENAHTGGRPTRGSGTLKRLRSASAQYNYSSDDSDGNGSMDIDDNDEDENQTDVDESSDEYLINIATAKELGRLRKDELLKLCISAEIDSDSVDSLTKSGLVDAIVLARQTAEEDEEVSSSEDGDHDEIPPSSPPGNSSDYSSDDGNVAEDDEEEEDATPHASRPGSSLKRRATINDLGKLNGRPNKSRSLSMGNVFEESSSGRRTSNRLSPPSQFAFPSPPATRLRSRKLSGSSSISTGITSAHAKKGKQVEFSDHVERHAPIDDGAESDLTELDVLEERLRTEPSPRRLRSKDKALSVSSATSSSGSSVGGSRRRRARTLSSDVVVADPVQECDEDPEVLGAGRRITPMRKAKDRIGNLREPDDSEDDAEMIEEDKSLEEQAEQEDEEVDQLSSSDELESTKDTRTPVRNRLRSRKLQTHTPPNDGENEVEEEDEDEEGEDDDDEETIAVQPRILRNGKIVGDEEDIQSDEETEQGSDQENERDAEQDSEVESDQAEQEMDLDQESDADAESINIQDNDAHGEDEEDEIMENDIDLTIATAKTLVRLRRDDLVRLCETRDLDVAGTKPQLAEALLEWRDAYTHEFSSPSSVGTVRPPSTIRRKQKHRKNPSGQDPTSTPPVLLRSQRVHTDEPRTPPLSQNRKEPEPEIELDLESLGLEDREIPPEKLTKLEKIGSGGFKDVYIGKFKGRKIAISEFRGHLTPMDIKELKLLGGFDHPNIVRFLGVSIPENTRETPVMIVSELCANGDLFDYVRNVPPPSLRKVLSIMLDIARGLEYLHMRKPSVIHRDCKSSNILITKTGVAKIADFGLAKVKQSTRSMVRSLVGTVNWQAPELWHAHPKYNHKVDVFSCAMVYWEMLQWHQTNKKFPWEGMNEHAIYEAVGAKRQRPSMSGLRKLWCPDVVDLVERMWAHEHQDRPTISEVVEELERIIRL